MCKTKRLQEVVLTLFLLISVVTFILLFLSGDQDATKGPGLLDCLRNISPWLLGLAFSFWLLNLLTDSYLLRVLLRAVDDDMPFRQCVYAFLGNEFLTAVTPIHSGGNRSRFTSCTITLSAARDPCHFFQYRRAYLFFRHWCLLL